MQIPSDIRPSEPPARRRPAETVRSSDAASDDQAGAGDANALDASDISRLVAAIKGLAPERLHRVEALRQRIADGSYSASPDELAGPLADLLGNGHGE